MANDAVAVDVVVQEAPVAAFEELLVASFEVGVWVNEVKMNSGNVMSACGGLEITIDAASNRPLLAAYGCVAVNIIAGSIRLRSSFAFCCAARLDFSPIG